MRTSPIRFPTEAKNTQLKPDIPLFARLVFRVRDSAAIQQTLIQQHPVRSTPFTLFAAQYSPKRTGINDWHQQTGTQTDTNRPAHRPTPTDRHQRLGGGTHADAIMGRIVHNATWIETGEWNMREHAARQATPPITTTGRHRRQPTTTHSGTTPQ